MHRYQLRKLISTGYIHVFPFFLTIYNFKINRKHGALSFEKIIFMQNRVNKWCKNQGDCNIVEMLHYEKKIYKIVDTVTSSISCQSVGGGRQFLVASTIRHSLHLHAPSNAVQTSFKYIYRDITNVSYISFRLIDYKFEINYLHEFLLIMYITRAFFF